MTIIKSITRKFIQATLLISVGFNLALATELKLPSDTPGLQKEIVQKNVNGTLTDCIEIKIPETDYSLFFPKNGAQPTTQEVGEYSGARYNLKKHNENANKLTLWYVNQFLDQAHIFEQSFSKTINNHDNLKPLDFSILTSIKDVEIIDILDECIHSMKIIASDPIGRALLYRIIIELYRTNDKGEDCCENPLNTTPTSIKSRNSCRKLKVITNNNSSKGYNWFAISGFLCFSPLNLGANSVLQHKPKSNLITVQAYQDENSTNITLFHELLHWFHFLKNPIRYSNPNRSSILLPSFTLTSIDLWRTPTYPNIEEIATILGTSQKDNQYTNGDDISENAYRISLSQNNPHRFAFSNQTKHYHMRWGHTSFHSSIEITIAPSPSNIPANIISAHTTAIQCYKETTDIQAINWNLCPKQAIK